MAKLNDLTGKTFGNWLVLERVGSTPNKASTWRCKCLLCGAEKIVAGYTLTSGSSTKCRSCVPKTTLSKPNRNTRLYHIYSGMKQRCTNPNNKSFANYGGRGIKVCEEWFNSPDCFIEWALSHGYDDSLTLERHDYNSNYCPENCCWISSPLQAVNTRHNIVVEYNGKKYALSEACRLANVSYNSVRSRKRSKDTGYQEAFDHFVAVNV